MDAALLTCSDADCLTVLNIANTIALCVLKRDESDDEVALCGFWEVLIGSRNVLEESRVVKLHLIPSLLEGNAKHLLAFNRSGNIVWVNLDDIVSSFALLSKDLQCFFSIVWGNDAVAHFALDDEGSCFVASIAKSDEISVTAHSVSTASTSIGTGNGTERHLDVVNEIDASQSVAQGQTNCCSSWGNVLETSCCGKTSSCFEFLNKLPTVQRIEEVNVSGTTSKNFERQFAFFHKDAGRFLIGVAAVFELQFFLCHIVCRLLFNVHAYNLLFLVEQSIDAIDIG